MPETRRAVVVVDVQQEYFSGPLAIEFPPVERSLANILAVLDVAAGEGIPVAVVRHEKPEGAALFAAGSPGWEFHPSLEARLDPAWKRITKSFASCFDHTDLAEWLSGHDVNTVTLVGYMTNNCILATQRLPRPSGSARKCSPMRPAPRSWPTRPGRCPPAGCTRT